MNLFENRLINLRRTAKSLEAGLIKAASVDTLAKAFEAADHNHKSDTDKEAWISIIRSSYLDNSNSGLSFEEIEAYLSPVHKKSFKFLWSKIEDNTRKWRRFMQKVLEDWSDAPAVIDPLANLLLEENIAESKDNVLRLRIESYLTDIDYGDLPEDKHGEQREKIIRGLIQVCRETRDDLRPAVAAFMAEDKNLSLQQWGDYNWGDRKLVFDLDIDLTGDWLLYLKMLMGDLPVFEESPLSENFPINTANLRERYMMICASKCLHIASSYANSDHSLQEDGNLRQNGSPYITHTRQVTEELALAVLPFVFERAREASPEEYQLLLKLVVILMSTAPIHDVPEDTKIWGIKAAIKPLASKHSRCDSSIERILSQLFRPKNADEAGDLIEDFDVSKIAKEYYSVFNDEIVDLLVAVLTALTKESEHKLRQLKGLKALQQNKAGKAKTLELLDLSAEKIMHLKDNLALMEQGEKVSPEDLQILVRRWSLKDDPTRQELYLFMELFHSVINEMSQVPQSKVFQEYDEFDPKMSGFNLKLDALAAVFEKSYPDLVKLIKQAGLMIKSSDRTNNLDDALDVKYKPKRQYPREGALKILRSTVVNIIEFAVLEHDSDGGRFALFNTLSALINLSLKKYKCVRDSTPYRAETNYDESIDEALITRLEELSADLAYQTLPLPDRYELMIKAHRRDQVA